MRHSVNQLTHPNATVDDDDDDATRHTASPLSPASVLAQIASDAALARALAAADAAGAMCDADSSGGGIGIGRLRSRRTNIGSLVQQDWCEQEFQVTTHDIQEKDEGACGAYMRICWIVICPLISST